MDTNYIETAFERNNPHLGPLDILELFLSEGMMMTISECAGGGESEREIREHWRVAFNALEAVRGWTR